MPTPADLLPTGVPGLDDILCGGLPPQRLYLVRGDSGTGKTTLAVQFLMEGARRGERCLYLGLSETAEELRAIARSHGWTLDDIELHELHAQPTAADRRGYTVFHPAEVELEETMRDVLETIRRVEPARFVIDSLSEVRLLAGSPFRLRRELMMLRDSLAGRRSTGLLLELAADDAAGDTIVHGVVELEQLSPVYGGERRRLRVTKLRGSRSIGGYHDFRIETGGVHVYPRLAVLPQRSQPQLDPVPSNLPQLDTLLGGGLARGTATVIMGPAGAGKSSLAAQFVAAAAGRGEQGVIYTFDESPATLLWRSESLGSALPRFVRDGVVRVVAVNPAELSPGQFAQGIVGEVDRGAAIVIIDSLNGYANAMPEERFLAAHLHELLSYLGGRNVLTVLTMAQHGLVEAVSPVDVSYIADTVLLLRYFEAGGRVRQALSVVKKRTGSHERTIRELSLGSDGIRIGPPLVEFRGVLTGTPEYTGVSSDRRLDADTGRADA